MWLVIPVLVVVLFGAWNGTETPRSVFVESVMAFFAGFAAGVALSFRWLVSGRI
jgi:hypothetical protein